MKRVIMAAALTLTTSAISGQLISIEASPQSETVVLASGKSIETRTLDTFFQNATREAAIPGLSFAFINDGRIVYQTVAGRRDLVDERPVTSETIFEAASLSKPLFGAFVVHLAERGVIDIDQPLIELYPHPDLDDDPRSGRFTARMVLSHQTGLPNWRSDLADGDLAILFEPGSRHSYSGEAYEYLADVLMHTMALDDEGLDQHFAKWLAKPLDLRATTFIQSDETLGNKAKGYRKGEQVKGNVDYRIAEFGAAHSVHTDAVNYAKAMIGLMQGNVLSDEGRKAFLKPQSVVIPEDHPQRPLGLSDWALGFSVYETPMGQFYVHGGNNRGFTSLAAINPQQAWGFVIMTNEDQADQFLQSVIAVLLGLADI